MKSTIAIFCILLCVSACSKREEPTVTTVGIAVTDFGKIYYPSVDDVYMKRITTADGVDCIIANRSSSVAMSCDFSKKEVPTK